jgi:hypothetical protein
MMALLLSGCSTLATPGKSDLMEKSDNWMKMVHWGEYDEACMKFAAIDSQQPCRQGFSGQGLVVVEQKVQDLSWDDDGLGATVTVSLEYVRPPSVTLKRTTHRQRWEVRDKRWQITGPFPELP